MMEVRQKNGSGQVYHKIVQKYGLQPFHKIQGYKNGRFVISGKSYESSIIVTPDHCWIWDVKNDFMYARKKQVVDNAYNAAKSRYTVLVEGLPYE